jgi:Flp pilus assembly protein TadD
MAEPKDERERIDHAHWDAVEDATELLHGEQFHDALHALREVIKKDQKNPYAYYYLGVALYELGEIEAARDAYRACLALAPNHLGARVSLSHVLRALGDTAGALSEGHAALEASPQDAEALHAVGLAHLARGDRASARRYLTAFLAARPEFEAQVEVRAILDSLADGPRKS